MISFHKNLSEGWELQSSEKVSTNGKMISGPLFRTNGWLTAGIPSTVLATLAAHGRYKDLYTGTNMKKVPAKQFRIPWWYRKVFNLSPEEIRETVLLNFDGINYKANIWLNGKLLADSQSVSGAFRRFRFNITSYVTPGDNILAVEVIPPGPGDFTLGFVDWNIDPPDQNMGLFREVTLHFNRGVSIENPFVETQFNPASPDHASLTVSTMLVNETKKKISGVLTAVIDKLQVSKPVTVRAGERKLIILTPEEFLELNILNPELWWPNHLGKPSLYKLNLTFEINREVSDINEVAFGIRKIEDYFNEGGHRGFKINGHKIIIKGAGWTDDLLLQDTHESLEAQIEYVKHLNLNCIRLEGFWGKDRKLYELCDQNGIMIMAGWSCHWEHEEYLGKPVDPLYGGITGPEEIELMAKAWKDQVLWLRNHPSIFVWNVGSDKIPHPDLEKKYVEIFKQYDRTRPYLNSTGGVGSEQGVITDVELVSEISGSSGMKMLGPYAYTPPVYWYTDKRFGGAYGFNTETCPGANVPPLESIKKMIPPGHLWPVDDVWEYHCGKNHFKTLDRVIHAIEKRYGKAENVEDFAFKSQILNYELMRPMFEAFQINKPRATGIIQWMLNSAWPGMYWQLFDAYLMPNGAFYATRKACKPIHLAYHYGNKSIHLINDLFRGLENHKAHIKILDMNSRIIFNETVQTGCPAESTSPVITLPENLNLSTLYFLDLRLLDENNIETDNNFYWLSTRQDVLDYDAEFEDWPFYTPSKEYADYTLLNKLEPVTLDVRFKLETLPDRIIVHFDIMNPYNRLAFFIEMNIEGEISGASLLPVFWDDNYISLLPGERRKLKVSVPVKSLNNEKPVLRIDGWNIKQHIIKLYKNVSTSH
ncbi:MAG: glycoside hydrolase family 2 [Chlorobi bacterium]|nr:glycoside hydrolase family 2 [Chlorobiota bacterium]